MIGPDSRYAGAPLAELVDKDGRVQRYAVPPLLPPAKAWTQTVLHRVSDADRLDLLAARAYDNAPAWVLIAGAQPVAHPAQVLDTPGSDIMMPRAGTAPDPLVGPDGNGTQGSEQ